MLFWLIDFFDKNDFHWPAVFGYTSTRMILSATFSMLFCILIGPYFIRKLYALKIGQTIRNEQDDCKLLGQLHQQKQNTPTMGGILILTSMILSLVVWMDLKHVFTWILLLTTLVFGFLGGRDDYLKLKYRNVKGLSAKKKLLFQSLFALFVASYFFFPGVSQFIKERTTLNPPLIKVEKSWGVEDFSLTNKNETIPSRGIVVLSPREFASRLYLPFFKEPMLDLIGFNVALIIFFWVFVIVGSSNAVNLTDGLDGLATGCLIMVATAFGLIAFISNNFDLAHYLNIPYIEGSGEIAVYMSAFAGACLGFLWYNSHPAQVFMGDIGSLALGAVLGVTAVLLKKELLLGIVGGVFVAEALSVILQVGSYRLRNKQRIFLCAPLHHHFEYKGWPETKVVIRFWIVALLLAIIGIASLKFQ